MNFFIYIIIAGIIQSYILSFFLIFSRKGNKKANRILGLLVILFSLSISHSALFPLGVYHYLPHLLMITQPLIFLFGPLFLFYERTLISRSFVLDAKKYFHFLPFIGCVALFSPFYFKNGDIKLLYLTGHAYQEITKILRMGQVFQVIQLLVYLSIINTELKNYHNKIVNSYSSLEKINLNWLRFIVYLFLLISGVIMCLLVITLTEYREFVSTYGSQIIGIIVSVYVYIIGYRGLYQPEIFVSLDEIGDEKKKTENKSIVNNEYSEIETRKLEQKLLNHLEQEKPYLDEDLTLPKLAEQLNMTRNQLSSLINDRVGENFFMFINKYRVEEVKKLLTDKSNNNFTILALAFEAGFRSKSSFNEIFKKFTGQTPMQFRNASLFQEKD